MKKVISINSINNAIIPIAAIFSLIGVFSAPVMSALQIAYLVLCTTFVIQVVFNAKDLNANNSKLYSFIALLSLVMAIAVFFLK